MEITWHGKTCFRFKGDRVAVVTNPDKDAGKLKADVVLSSLPKGDLVEVEDARVFDWPGEYEVKDVPIIGFRAWTKSKSKEEEEGGEGEPTVIYYFEVDGVKICHLGFLGHVLTSDIVKKIGDVDVLLVSVGEDSNLPAKKAMEVIEAIEPRIVIPMGTKNPGSFMKDLGADKFEEEEKYVVKGRSSLPDENRIFVVLKHT
ncbi:MBL fold metallo-hydrolase [Patescibacteria group bacterium]|nr:MBL fold metallo-hydrolase [Patescibacteria group bacterium]